MSQSSPLHSDYSVEVLSAHRLGGGAGAGARGSSISASSTRSSRSSRSSTSTSGRSRSISSASRGSSPTTVLPGGPASGNTAVDPAPAVGTHSRSHTGATHTTTATNGHAATPLQGASGVLGSQRGSPMSGREFAMRLKEGGGGARVAWGSQSQSHTQSARSQSQVPTPGRESTLGAGAAPPSLGEAGSPDPAAATAGLLCPEHAGGGVADPVPRANTAPLSRSSIRQRIKDAKRGTLGLHLLRQPTVPEMELATGFAAKVYGELLHAKKDVHALEDTRNHLVAKHRRLQKELYEEERKYKCLLETHVVEPRGSGGGRAAKATPAASLSSLAKGARARPGSAKSRTRSVCGTLLLNETARASAYKESLSQMMVELKKILDAIRQAKSRSAYKHHEKLAETSAYLGEEIANMKRLIETKSSRHTRETHLMEAERTRAKIEEREMIVEFLNAQIKAVQNEVRDLQLAVSTAYNKGEAQRELKEHLLSKLKEARATTKAKEEDLTSLEAKLRTRLSEIEAHTRAQCTELSVMKADGDQRVNLQREALLSKAAHAEKLKQVHSDQGAALGQLMERLAKAQTALQDEEAHWAEEEATLYSSHDKVERERCATLQREWAEEKTHLAAQLEAATEGVEEVQTKIERAQHAHQDRLNTLRDAAEHRQDLLLDQLKD